MGLGFTIDTPIKVAHFGISSVMSIIEDHLVEQMREVLCRDHQLTYEPIGTSENDYRARRITAYLNLVNRLVKKNTEKVRASSFHPGSDIVKYFELLPGNSSARRQYYQALELPAADRTVALEALRKFVVPGNIDVNIMTKVDKQNYDKNGDALPAEYSDALSALRGYANSDLCSSIVFSAGLNPRLYSYCETFPDFFPDASGHVKKKIILKVSDYRSALIQGKFLAKKGLWISEYRIESGLNCGGHAFATDGLLLGPILEEFKTNREALRDELFTLCSASLALKGASFKGRPNFKISVQGGIGTAEENLFLMNRYSLDATGWGSPFLLVPEATTVDKETLNKLAGASPDDYYISYASPLGIPFNNFRHSSSEEQRRMRISKNRPGSPCYKKFLSTNTEFTKLPICTASREYQDLKIKQLTETIKDPLELKEEVSRVTEKDCLCEGLGAASLISNQTKLSHGLKAVAICPGPNLAYFSGIFSLKDMVDHIYGRKNILNNHHRPHVFVNELRLYVDYLKKEVEKSMKALNQKQLSYFQTFKSNLIKGIEYYTSILPVAKSIGELRQEMSNQLNELRKKLEMMDLDLPVAAG